MGGFSSKLANRLDVSVQPGGSDQRPRSHRLSYRLFSGSAEGKGMGRMDIRSVKIKYELQLMKLPNVTGIAIGEKEGKAVIKVYVKEKIPASALQKENVIPQSLEGYEVDVEEIGNVRTQSS